MKKQSALFLAAIIFIVVCFVHTVSATVRTFEFRGTITYSGVSGVSINDPFVATLTYDDTQSPTSSFGRNTASYGSYSYVLTVSNMTFNKQPGGFIAVNHFVGSVDQFAIVGTIPALQLDLRDNSATTFNSSALPTSLSLTDFSDLHTVVWTSVPGIFHGNITSITEIGPAPEPGTSKKTIILAIDGGGIKGLIPATFLQAIEARIGKPSYQLFDLIGGTSTGGIISVALTSPSSQDNTRPFSAAETVNIYKTKGSDIFVAQPTVKTEATYYANNNGAGIEPYLQKILGTSTKLSDSYKFIHGLSNARVKQMFTTSYIVNSTGDAISAPVRGQDYGPYLFNWKDANSSPNHDYYVWEAARGTSAAPVYFPIAHVGGNQAPRSAAASKWVIDGGTMSNSPAVWGISEALQNRYGYAFRGYHTHFFRNGYLSWKCRS